jgi:Na+-translocating ferredoxin:NAD+ oxidoreductase RnfD subunit
MGVMSEASSNFKTLDPFLFGSLRRKLDLSRFFPDPRVPVLMLLVGFLVLGFTVLGFNRTPIQALMTSVSAVALEVFLFRVLRGKWVWPLSALITSCGLSLLLNYGHDYWILLAPVYFAIGTKYVFTLKGKHVYNPAQIAVVLSLLLMNELITSAPAYQWNGTGAMAYFITVPALMLFMPSIDRTPLVFSFLITFTAQTFLRAMIMRHHLPFETLFWGTLSSPSFLLFTFFMITDPATSPKGKKEQIWTGIAIATVDLLFHIRKSYYTFFFAAFTVATAKYLYRHYKLARQTGSLTGYCKASFWDSGYWKNPLLVGTLGVAGWAGYTQVIVPSPLFEKPQWKLEKIETSHHGVNPQWGATYDRLDPRIQHIAKWILSVGDSVSIGDYDQDGLADVFLTLPLKSDADRMSLYRNLGNFKFERVPLPAVAERAREIEKFGLPTNANWIDVDNDGDLDLFITYAFGSPVLLKNLLKETGKPSFTDITKPSGLEHFTNSISAVFLDINRDGRPDLFIANVLPPNLPGYETPTPLNLFHLPQPAYEGDRRMFHFMHHSWNLADNGGENEIWIQNAEGKFERQDSVKWGLPETGWSLAVSSADFNRDGWPDIYVANDFGPDDLYLNEEGRHFRNFKGTFFGSIGRDTYKGMNVSIGDLDRNDHWQVYVSNVHHDLQAEGSLLWDTWVDAGGNFHAEDRATQKGVLNERRFGWGATIADLDNDGWPDIAQANGMVDDSRDKKWDECPDYWYVNEKIARSPPEIHAYADAWGDIRGMCIHPKEGNRIYWNRGTGHIPQFTDLSEEVGWEEKTTSRGIASADLDNDGRMDLIVTHLFQGPTFYRNVWKGSSDSPSWIEFQLEGDGLLCGTSAVGTEIRLLPSEPSPEPPQRRLLTNATGLNAQDDQVLHFGLGVSPAKSYKAQVLWCGQYERSYDLLEPRQRVRLKFDGKKDR